MGQNVENGFRMEDCKVEIDSNEHFRVFIMPTLRILQ